MTSAAFKRAEPSGSDPSHEQNDGARAQAGRNRGRDRDGCGRRDLVVLLVPILIVTLVSAYGWGLTRFREAADISLMVLAAVGLVELWRRLPSSSRWSSGPSSGGA
jgi:hypothetical protein